MSLPYRVTLLGFSSFERSALSSYFRLATNRTPSYEQVAAPGDAHFLIVDADHDDAVRDAADRMGDAVFIGIQPPDGASASMARPIDPLRVLRELDAMVEARSAGRSTATDAARPTAGTARPPSWRPAGAGSGFIEVPAAAVPRAGVAARANVGLLVDDSEVALRFLESRLQRFGLQLDRATTSGRAIELLARNPYDFIFLDIELGADSELDGLSLCQHIKRSHRHVGDDREPVIVLVSAHHSEVDRARGALAGADGYLAKPLDDTALARLLRHHGVSAPAA